MTHAPSPTTSKKRQPNNVFSDTSPRQSKTSRKKSKILLNEAAVIEVWRQTVEDWDPFSANIVEPALILAYAHPIPYTIRSDVWFVVSGARDLMLKNRDVFAHLAACTDCDSKHLDRIEKDLTRTFPNKEINVQYVHVLRQVLIAYANFDPTIGYTQGMNYIAGFIIRQFMEAMPHSYQYPTPSAEEEQPQNNSNRNHNHNNHSNRTRNHTHNHNHSHYSSNGNTPSNSNNQSNNNNTNISSDELNIDTFIDNLLKSNDIKLSNHDNNNSKNNDIHVVRPLDDGNDSLSMDFQIIASKAENEEQLLLKEYLQSLNSFENNSKELLTEKAFWTFVVIINKVSTLFCDKLPGFHKSVECFRQLCTYHGPYALAAHLNELNVYPIMCTSWFHSLFTYPSMNRNIAKRIWDIFFLTQCDFSTMLKIAYLIVLRHENELLDMDFVGIICFCKSEQCMIHNQKDDHRLIDRLSKLNINEAYLAPIRNLKYIVFQANMNPSPSPTSSKSKSKSKSKSNRNHKKAIKTNPKHTQNGTTIVHNNIANAKKGKKKNHLRYDTDEEREQERETAEESPSKSESSMSFVKLLFSSNNSNHSKNATKKQSKPTDTHPGKKNGNANHNKTPKKNNTTIAKASHPPLKNKTWMNFFGLQ